MLNKKLILWLGIILVIVGLIGFFNNPVLGLFKVNTMHNLVHILTGILAIVFAMASVSAAMNYAKVFGIIYALVTILGLVSSSGMVLGMAINGADNFLHLLLAIVFLVLGFAPLGEKSMSS